MVLIAFKDIHSSLLLIMQKAYLAHTFINYLFRMLGLTALDHCISLNNT